MNKRRCFISVVCFVTICSLAVGWRGWADEEPANVIGYVDEETVEQFPGGSDFFLFVKDTSRHIDEAVQTFEAASAVYSAGFSPGGGEILTASEDGAAQLWDIETAETVAEFPITTHTEPQPLQMEDVHPSQPAAISPDGRRVLTGFKDPPIRMWDAETGELIRTFTWGVDAVTALAFSHDGSQVLAVLARRDNGGGMRPTGIEGGRAPRRLTGNVIAKAWDAESGELLDVSDEIRRIQSQHYRRLTLLSPSPVNGEVLVGVRPVRESPYRITPYEEEYSVRRWTPLGGEGLPAVWRPNVGQIFHGVFTANGVPFLAVYGRHSNHLEFWDAAKEERVMTWPPGTEDNPFSVDEALVVDPGWGIHWEPPMAFEVSPCVTHAVMAYGPHAPARLWNIETGELVRSFTGHEKGPISVAFSPCGDYVLTGSWDGTARLWESGIGEE